MRSRILYAFRVYAAIYGHRIVEHSQPGAIRCFYGWLPSGVSEGDVFPIPALYQRLSQATVRTKFAKCWYAGEEFHLCYGLDERVGRPDWLGEIFNWLSGAYEAGIAVRDSIGRIPYCETVFGQGQLSLRKPHAALLMAWMEDALHSAGRGEALPKAPSPAPGIDHVVVSSHDVDFYFVDRISALVRLAKNLGIAIGVSKSLSYFLDNLKMIFQLLGGRRIGDYLQPLMEASATYSLSSTFFVVSRHGHRRDPNYRLKQIAEHVADAAGKGFSVGLHGSYRSIVEDRSLAEEARALAECLGRAPIAGRQHWLRFSRHRDLFAEVIRAGLSVDSSLGFPDAVGFRNGASFAFPPYDFDREAPCEFLEIPLVLMDGGLQVAATRLGRSAEVLAEEVLAESRKAGWGGVAALWHNPIEPLSVPTEVNQVFWECAKKQKDHCEKWVAVEDFLAVALPRYHQAGLLGRVRLDGRLHLAAGAKG